MSVNIYDVARKAGVSSATVSRVLNGRPHVREVTKKRVMDIINEMNYTPNALARKLSTGNTLNIGFLIPDIENPFFSHLLRGLTNAADGKMRGAASPITILQMARGLLRGVSVLTTSSSSPRSGARCWTPM